MSQTTPPYTIYSTTFFVDSQAEAEALQDRILDSTGQETIIRISPSFTSHYFTSTKRKILIDTTSELDAIAITLITGQKLIRQVMKKKST